MNRFGRVPPSQEATRIRLATRCNRPGLRRCHPTAVPGEEVWAAACFAQELLIDVATANSRIAGGRSRSDAACARPSTPRSRKAAIAIHRTVFRPRVSEVPSHHRRFEPRDGWAPSQMLDGAAPIAPERSPVSRPERPQRTCGICQPRSGHRPRIVISSSDHRRDPAAVPGATRAGEPVTTRWPAFAPTVFAANGPSSLGSP